MQTFTAVINNSVRKSSIVLNQTTKKYQVVSTSVSKNTNVFLNQTVRKFNTTLIQSVKKYEVKNTGIVYRIVVPSEGWEADLASKADKDHDHEIGNMALLFENQLI